MKSFLKKREKSSDKKTPDAPSKKSGGKKSTHKEKSNPQRTIIEETVVGKSSECLVKRSHKAKDKQDGKKKLQRIFTKNSELKNDTLSPSQLDTNSLLEKKNNYARRQKLLTSIASDQNLPNFEEIERRALRERSIKRRGYSRSSSQETKQSKNRDYVQAAPFSRSNPSGLPRVSEEDVIETVFVNNKGDFGVNNKGDLSVNNKGDYGVKHDPIPGPEEPKSEKFNDDCKSDSSLNEVEYGEPEKNVEPSIQHVTEETVTRSVEIEIERKLSVQPICEENEEHTESNISLEESERTECHSESDRERNKDENAELAVPQDEPKRLSPVNSVNIEEETPLSIDENKTNYLRSYHKRQQRNTIQDSLTLKLQNSRSKSLLDFLKGSNLPSALEDRKRLVTDTIESIKPSKVEGAERETPSQPQSGLCNHGRSHTIKKSKNLDKDNHSESVGSSSSFEVIKHSSAEPPTIDRDVFAPYDERKESQSEESFVNNERIVSNTVIKLKFETSLTKINEMKARRSKVDFNNNADRAHLGNVCRVASRSLEDTKNYSPMLSYSRKSAFSDSIVRRSKIESLQRDKYQEHRSNKIMPTEPKGSNEHLSDKLSKQVYGDGSAVTPIEPHAAPNDITHLKRLPSKESVPWVRPELQEYEMTSERVTSEHFPRKDNQEVELVTKTGDYSDQTLPLDSSDKSKKSCDLLNPLQNLEGLFQPQFKEVLTTRDSPEPCIVVYNDKNFNYSPKALIEKALKLSETSDGKDIDVGLSDTFLDELRDICVEIFEAKMLELRTKPIQADGTKGNFFSAASGGDNDGTMSKNQTKLINNSTQISESFNIRNAETGKINPEKNMDDSLKNREIKIESESFIRTKIQTEMSTCITRNTSKTIKLTFPICREGNVIPLEKPVKLINLQNRKDYLKPFKLKMLSSAIDVAMALDGKIRSGNLGDCLHTEENPRVFGDSLRLVGGGLDSSQYPEHRESSGRPDHLDATLNRTDSHLGTDKFCSNDQSKKLKRKFSYDHWVTIHRLQRANMMKTSTDEKLGRRSSVPSLPRKISNLLCDCDGKMFDSLESKSCDLSPTLNRQDVRQQNSVPYRNKKLTLSKASLREKKIPSPPCDAVKNVTSVVLAKTEVPKELNLKNSPESKADHENKQKSVIHKAVEEQESEHSSCKEPESESSEIDSEQLEECTDFISKETVEECADFTSKETVEECTDFISKETDPPDTEEKQNTCSDDSVTSSQTPITEKNDSPSEDTTITSASTVASESGTRPKSNVMGKQKSKIKKKYLHPKNGAIITTRFGTQVICQRESKQSILSATEGVLKVPTLHENKQNVTVLFEEVIPPPTKRKYIQSVNINELGAQTRFGAQKKLSMLQSPIKLQFLPPVTKRQDFINKWVKESTVPTQITQSESDQRKLESFVAFRRQNAQMNDEIKSVSPLQRARYSDESRNISPLQRAKLRGESKRNTPPCQRADLSDDSTGSISPLNRDQVKYESRSMSPCQMTESNDESSRSISPPQRAQINDESWRSISPPQRVQVNDERRKSMSPRQKAELNDESRRSISPPQMVQVNDERRKSMSPRQKAELNDESRKSISPPQRVQVNDERRKSMSPRQKAELNDESRRSLSPPQRAQLNDEVRKSMSPRQRAELRDDSRKSMSPRQRAELNDESRKSMSPRQRAELNDECKERTSPFKRVELNDESTRSVSPLQRVQLNDKIRSSMSPRQRAEFSDESSRSVSPPQRVQLKDQRRRSISPLQRVQLNDECRKSVSPRLRAELNAGRRRSVSPLQRAQLNEESRKSISPLRMFQLNDVGRRCISPLSADCTQLYARLFENLKSSGRSHSDDALCNLDGVEVDSVKSKKSITSSLYSYCGSTVDESFYTTNESTMDSNDSDLVRFFRALRMEPVESENDGQLCTTDSSSILLHHETQCSNHILSNVNVFRQSSRDVCPACEVARQEKQSNKSSTPTGICNTPEKKLRKKQDSRHTVRFEPNNSSSKTDLKSVNPVQNCTSFVFSPVSVSNIPQQQSKKAKSVPVISSPGGQIFEDKSDNKELESRVKNASRGAEREIESRVKNASLGAERELESRAKSISCSTERDLVSSRAKSTSRGAERELESRAKSISCSTERDPTSRPKSTSRGVERELESRAKSNSCSTERDIVSRASRGGEKELESRAKNPSRGTEREFESRAKNSSRGAERELEVRVKYTARVSDRELESRAESTSCGAEGDLALRAKNISRAIERELESRAKNASRGTDRELESRVINASRGTEREVETRLKNVSRRAEILSKDIPSISVKQSFSCCPSVDEVHRSRRQETTRAERTAHAAATHDIAESGKLLVMPQDGNPARVYIDKPGTYRLHLFVPKPTQDQRPCERDQISLSPERDVKKRQYDRYGTFY